MAIKRGTTRRSSPPKTPGSSTAVKRLTRKSGGRVRTLPQMREMAPITIAQVKADKTLKPRARAAIIKALEQRKIDEG